MKNRLIPINRSATDDTFEPSLIPSGFVHESLVKSKLGGYRLKYQGDGFSKRPDLDGRVRNQTGPVIETDAGELMMICGGTKHLLQFFPTE